MIKELINFIFLIHFIKSKDSKHNKNKEFYEVVIVTRDNCYFSEGMRNWLLKNNIVSYDFNTTYMGRDIRPELGRPEATFPLVFIKKDKYASYEYVGGYTDFKESNYAKFLRNNHIRNQ